LNEQIDLKWLTWAREIQSLAQTGLAFAPNHYEKERSSRLIEISAEIIKEYTNLKSENISKVLMEQPGYATPKVDVRAAIIRDNKILLVKEIADGKWSMPGGWMDVGDYPAQAAEREAIEESGFVVKAKKLIGAFDANRNGRPLEFFHAVKLIYLCEIISGKPTISNETSEVKFFTFDNLPSLSQNRTNKRHIAEIIEHLKDTNRQAFFE